MQSIDTIKNKTILLQTTYQPTPHLETELEIMERLLEQGNKIYWLICQEDFQACFHNPTHETMSCKECYSRVSKGVSVLKKQILNHENLSVLKYHEFQKLSDFKKEYKAKQEFNDIVELKKYKYGSYDSGMATASSLVSYCRDHLPDLSQYNDFIQRGLITGAYLFDTFQLILDAVKPDLVILFNGRFIENRPLLRKCQELGLDYATHERGGKLNRFLFRINSIPHAIETVAEEMEVLWNTSNEDKNKIGASFYQNRIQKVEDAWYSFTKGQQEGRLPESFNDLKDKKVVTIFNSSLDEYEGLEGFGPYFYENDNEGIKQICNSLAEFLNIKLYLRIHPNLKGLNNSQNDYLRNVIEPIKSVEIIKAEDSVDTYALIDKSDIIIVFGSTVGAEALYAGKKVILLGRGAYENLKGFVIPKSHEELMQILTNDYYDFPEIIADEPLKYGYWNESFGYDYKYYEAINIASGTYRGKKIKANSAIRELKRIVRKLKGTYKK